MLGISLRNLLPVEMNISVIVDIGARCAENGVTLTRGLAAGKSWENGLLLRNGSARMYSLDRWEEMA